MNDSPLQGRRDEESDPRSLPLAPLIWSIGYSGLHIMVLFRAVMAYQCPELLVTPGFWLESLAIATVFACMMTAGWGRKPRR